MRELRARLLAPFGRVFVYFVLKDWLRIPHRALIRYLWGPKP